MIVSGLAATAGTFPPAATKSSRLDALGDRQPPALDQVERLIDLGALGLGLLLGQVPDGEVVPLAPEPERAVLAVALLPHPRHRRVSLRKRPVAALLAEIWRKNRRANEKGLTALSAVSPFAASAEERT